MKSQKLSGYWWLPDSPSQTIPGTLNLSVDNGIELNLMDRFGSQLPTHNIENMPRYPLILGVTQNGKEITLEDAQTVEEGFSVPGFERSTLLARAAYSGGHFKDKDALRFCSARLETNHLLTWMRKSQFHHRIPSQEQITAQPFEVGYILPEPVRAKLPGGELSIGQSISSHETLFEAILRTSAYVQWEGGEKRSLDDWYRFFIRPVQNLLSLGTRTRVRATHFTVFSESETPDDKDSSRKRRPIEVFYRGLHQDDEKQQDLRRDTVLFLLVDMEPNYETMINNWFKLSEKLEGILNLYFSIRDNPDTYLEHQFLSIVQVLEGYHRLRFSNELLLHDEYERRCDEVLAAIPDKHLRWIKGKFQFGNEPSLRARLHKLIDSAGQVIEPWIAGNGGKESFTRKIRDLRGSLTHPGATSVDGDKLFKLTEALSFLFESCLLLELGFNIDQTLNLFRRNQRYGLASQRASK